ncbi:MAG: DUF4153 domain-containing protein [Clostridiaceae bacterium]|nr:DUF4153 domain-containing protein [Clostridiaceae bacterium]
MKTMKKIRRLQERLRGLSDAIARYPLTAAFLMAAAVINAFDISTGKDYSKFLITFVVGAFLGSVLQAAYERFFYRSSGRMALMGAAVLFTAGYYLIIMPAPKLGIEIGIRTSVALFALLVAFIWTPVIRSKISFNESFMAAFKAFFNSLLFSGVIMGGISIIIAAIDQLLFPVDYRAYSHAAGIVFILFAPMYFLSLIPIYPGTVQENMDVQKEKTDKAVHCPKFLEILLSYIIVPLISVFTIILLIYIIRNIGGKFWTDNLLEPMLVSYSITVILMYILTSELGNRFSVYFRMIFPKVLVPIVIFQIVSSVMSLGDTGITHTRYYVILFGIFAAAAGIIMSIVPVRKNGIIAAMLIVFALISVVPPVDAFTVSRRSQTDMLEAVLVKNNMLSDNMVKPNSSIPEEDKKIIIKSIEYLSMMDYTGKIEWLPDDFIIYEDFQKTFGFNQYEIPGDLNQNVYLGLEQQISIDITGYDSFAIFNIQINGQNTAEKICDIIKSGETYTLSKRTAGDQGDVYLTKGNQELIRFSIREIFDKFYEYNTSKGLINAEEATFTKENELAKITIVVQNLSIDKASDRTYYGADLYALIKIK